MTLPHDSERCHGLQLAVGASVLLECWGCKRHHALVDMGPRTPVWRPAVALVAGEDGVARVDCPKRLPVA